MLVFEWVQHPTQAQDRNDIWKLILKLLICCFKLLKRAGPTTPPGRPLYGEDSRQRCRVLGAQ